LAVKKDREKFQEEKNESNGNSLDLEAAQSGTQFPAAKIEIIVYAEDQGAKSAKS